MRILHFFHFFINFPYHSMGITHVCHFLSIFHTSQWKILKFSFFVNFPCYSMVQWCNGAMVLLSFFLSFFLSFSLSFYLSFTSKYAYATLYEAQSVPPSVHWSVHHVWGETPGGRSCWPVYRVSFSHVLFLFLYSNLSNFSRHRYQFWFSFLWFLSDSFTREVVPSSLPLLILLNPIYIDTSSPLHT